MTEKISLVCQTWNLQVFTLDYAAGKTSLPCLLKKISGKLRHLPVELIRLTQSSKDIVSVGQINPEYTLKIELKGSLKGGKGGFGSLLRSMKPKNKEGENFEACRDLSGRRLRNVNNEQRLAEWRRKQEEEEKYVQEELKEYDKNKKTLQGAIR